MDIGSADAGFLAQQKSIKQYAHHREQLPHDESAFLFSYCLFRQRPGNRNGNGHADHRVVAPDGPSHILHISAHPLQHFHCQIWFVSYLVLFSILLYLTLAAASIL